MRIGPPSIGLVLLINFIAALLCFALCCLSITTLLQASFASRYFYEFLIMPLVLYYIYALSFLLL